MKTIEYLADAVPGARIDLERLNRGHEKKNPHLEQYLPLLKSSLRQMSREVNNHYGEFLGEDGKIMMIGSEAESDQRLVEQQEVGFANSLSPAEYRAEREANQAEIAEMTLTLLFDKLLGDRFIIARASAYDDYNGVDQVIIDKTTGVAVCGVDEVVSHAADTSAPKKEEKMARKMQHGGATVKYGATMKEGRLIRQSLRNIPTFYVAVNPSEMEKIIGALEAPEKHSTMEELAVFDRVIASLETQYNKLDVAGFNPNLRENLKKFATSLEKMKRAK